MPSYIVDSSFFVRDINIPNTGDSKVSEKVQSFIAKYEPECLVRILGYPLFKLSNSEESARMTSLLEGGEFINCRGELDKWQGLVHDTDVSLIANYIYFFFLEATTSNILGTGTNSIQKPESGFAISPVDKQVNAWNLFSQETAKMCEFLLLKKTNGVRDYPEFSNHQYRETLRISRPINAFGL